MLSITKFISYIIKEDKYFTIESIIINDGVELGKFITEK
jgi:hypothetical protein